MEEFLKLGTDPYDVIRLFPDLLPQQNESPEVTGNLAESDLEAGLSALIEYLTEVRYKIQAGEPVCTLILLLYPMIFLFFYSLVCSK